jgi:intraflagellar transport protein 56
MMMRRAPQAAGAARRAVAKAAPAKADKKPSLEVFVANGDFTGAVTLLEFERRAGEETPMTLPWLGYCAFHLGDYTKALKAYKVWRHSVF